MSLTRDPGSTFIYHCKLNPISYINQSLHSGVLHVCERKRYYNTIPTIRLESFCNSFMCAAAQTRMAAFAFELKKRNLINQETAMMQKIMHAENQMFMRGR